MLSDNIVIIIPGLGDRIIKPLELAVAPWRLYGLEPVVYRIGWRDGETSFKPKLQKLLDRINFFSQNGVKVSLVGTSAGGSAALNAFIARKNTIHRVINVCGRLRVGLATGFRSFDYQSKSSLAFAESVKLCEAQQEIISSNDRHKIMTVKAMFGDELVPSETVTIDGAYNIGVPTFEHMFSISMSLTLFSRLLLDFLKTE